MAVGRKLQIFRDGRRNQAYRTLMLPPAAQGNLETLQIMAQIVREDAAQRDLKAFMLRFICPGKQSRHERIEAIFKYCRDKIIYLPEGDQTETVADLWSCIFFVDETGQNALGDCAVKSVAVATCLALLGLKPKFVVVRQDPRVDYFNHVFVVCEIDGVETVYDATPPEFQIGDEVHSVVRYAYPIFQ